MSQTKAQLVSPIGILTAIGVNVSGIVTASGFVGNGSGLTNISSSSISSDISINTSGIITASSFSSVNGFNIDGNLNVNGDVTAINFRSTSDINLKENVSDIENSLEIVSQLRGVSFNWKETGDKSYGVIAQELEEVLPELVSNTNPKTVYYDALIGILIESIKDLKLEVESIKNNK